MNRIKTFNNKTWFCDFLFKSIEDLDLLGDYFIDSENTFYFEKVADVMRVSELFKRCGIKHKLCIELITKC